MSESFGERLVREEIREEVHEELAAAAAEDGERDRALRALVVFVAVVFVVAVPLSAAVLGLSVRIFRLLSGL